MKRLMVLGFVVMLVSAAAYLASAAEIYWDGSVPDDTITDKDFSRSYDASVPSPAPRGGQVYDNFQVPDIEPRAERAPGAPIPSQSLETPARVAPSVQRSETSRQPRVVAPRQPETSRRSSTIGEPRPAETAPGGEASSLELPAKGADSKDLNADLRKAVPPSTPEAEAQRPTTRKMRWGQVDVKPSEPKAQPQSEEGPETVE